MERRGLVPKTVIMIFVFILGSVLLGGQAAIAAEKTIKMTVAHADVGDPTQNAHAASVGFKEYVEKASKGKIKVTISPGGALGNTASLQEMTMTGEIAASTTHTEGTIAIVYPNIQVISIPYLFHSVDQALEVMRGEYGQRMYEDLRRKTGLRTVAIWDNGGFRSFANNVRPIRSPKDMKGLKFRTMDNPAHIELVRALGAKPTPISWAEVYTAVQTGVVDGMEAPIPIIIVGSLHEVHKYYTLDRHVYSQQHFFVNDAWFNKLSKGYQDIILRGGEKAQYRGQQATRVYREIGKEFLTKYLKIYEPTSEEINMFREMSQGPVLKYIRGKAVDDPKWVDDILAAAKKADKKLGYAK
jgi:tripartite ATP-independent transporter DctP family solute receptor